MTTLNDALNSLGTFTPAEKSLIANSGTYVTVPNAWAPIIEGTPGDKVYLILEGEVSVKKQRQEIARLGAGELVGETSIARRKLRNATVVAETPLRVLHFTPTDWQRLIARVPSLSEAVAERALARA